MFFSLTAFMQQGHNDANQMHPIVRNIRKLVSGFDMEKYWKRRTAVVDQKAKVPALINCKIQQLWI